MAKLASTKEDIKIFYSSKDVSDSYIDKRFNNPIGMVMHRRQVGLINDAIKSYNIKNILELAPGPARVSADLEGFDRGVMVETNNNMLDIAKVRLDKKGVKGRWQFVLGDVFEFRPEEKFDLVYTLRFIRHFDRGMRMRLYGNIKNYLKEGGFFILDVPNVSVKERTKEKGAVNEIYDELYTKQQFSDEMEENGFRVIKMTAIWAHYLSIQYWIQVLVGPRWPQGAYFLINLFEHDGARNPAEWIALCQKK